MMHTLDFLIIIVAKNLHCHSQLPEKLAEGQEKATGLRTRCDAETSYCWKTDTPGGIGQGCADRDVQEVVTYAFGQLSGSCATMELGDPYTICACHSDMCNTAPIIKGSNGFKAGLLFTWISSFYLRPTWRD